MTAAHEVLRAGTRDSHSRVDAAFSRFDLGRQASYLSFLDAHARAVVPIETALAVSLTELPWRPRGPMLRADLQVLGLDLPATSSLALSEGMGQFCGMIYVIEGSRLGGSVLASRVGASLPISYLSATHRKGEWRALLAAIDACANSESEEWLDDAVAGAKRAFTLFEDAANGILTPV